MMKIILAIDSFKGCLTSAEVGNAAASAVAEALPGAQVEQMVVSDGGDGMAEAFAAAVGGSMQHVAVHDAMMRRVDAYYALAPDGTAMIEVAQACGLAQIAPDERNPMRATSYGVGEMVACAVKRGCRKFVVGLGGSATSDAGIGMLRALVDCLSPHGTIDDVLAGPMAGCQFTLACDVDNPLCGPKGAAAVFAPQKGADADMVEMLDGRARRFAQMSAKHFGKDCSEVPGAGAAGGLGYAFMQYLGAKAESGADLLLRISRFDEIVSDAALVITGEGSADAQTLMGKFPQRVLACCRKHGVPVWLLAGRVRDGAELARAGFACVESINPSGISVAEALRPDVAKANIKTTVERLIRERL